ncbi:MAG: preprotein translocase subunit TatC [Sphingobium sp. 66-54]|nr:MAG: preprotein translocase subunit TatC [Sphingobium sp. 66-54]
MNGAVVLAETDLERLIPRFYARVREDAQLGPVFNDIVEDWPEHLEKLVAFWSSVMLGSGRYKGNPVMAHGRHSTRMPPELFARWLEIWADVTNEEMAPAIAAALQAKAGRIAESLQLAMFFRLAPERGAVSQRA